MISGLFLRSFERRNLSNEWVREIDARTREGESGVASVLVILDFGSREDDRSLGFAEDVILVALDMLIEHDELTTLLLLDEVGYLIAIGISDDDCEGVGTARCYIAFFLCC